MRIAHVGTGRRRRRSLKERIEVSRRGWFVAVVVLAAAGYGLFRMGQLSSRPSDGFTTFTPAQPSTAPPFPPVQGGRNSAPPGFPLGRGPTFQAVDLNSAPLADLQTIPGITADYAKKIIAGRPFRSIDDIERVGIPHEVVQHVSPPAILRVSGEPYFLKK